MLVDGLIWLEEDEIDNFDFQIDSEDVDFDIDWQIPWQSYPDWDED